MEIFSNIINQFTVTCDQFNVSLLKLFTFLSKKILKDSRLLIGSVISVNIVQ